LKFPFLAEIPELCIDDFIAAQCRHFQFSTDANIADIIRELHGDGDDSITAVMRLDFTMDTAVIAGMGAAFTVILR